MTVLVRSVLVEVAAAALALGAVVIGAIAALGLSWTQTVLEKLLLLRGFPSVNLLFFYLDL